MHATPRKQKHRERPDIEKPPLRRPSHEWASSGGFDIVAGDGRCLISGSVGGESVPLDLEQVVDGADEPPFTRRSVKSSP